MRVEIEIDESGAPTTWFLCGDARLLARGELTEAAERRA